MRKQEWIKFTLYITQMSLLIILYLRFEARADELAQSTSLALSASGMAPAQISAITSSISSLGGMMALYVLGFGFVIGLFNLAEFLSPNDNRRQ